MNGNNHKENRLNELFAKAKQQGPLLSNEDVHNLITHAPTSVFPGKQLVNYFKSHLKLMIMTTIVSSFLISVFVWYLPGIYNSEMKPDNKDVTIQKDYVSSYSINSSSTKANQIIRKDINEQPSQNSNAVDIKKTNISLLDSKNSTNSVNSSDNYLISDPSQNNKDTTLLLQETFNGDEYILSLSLKEICNLGFQINDSAFYNFNQGPDSIISSSVYWYNSKRSSFNLGPHYSSFAIQAVKAGYLSTNNDFYPVYTTGRYMLSMIQTLTQNKSNFEKELLNPPYTEGPTFEEKGPSKNDNNKDSTMVNGDYLATLRETRRVLGGNMHGRQIPFRIKNFEIINDTLVPIHLYLDDMDSINPKNYSIPSWYTNKIYWFRSSPAFYNALPERYREKTKTFYEKIKDIKKQQKNNNKDIVIYPSINLLKNSIASIRKLELTKEELKRLGFIINKNSIEYQNQLEDRLYISFYFDNRQNIVRQSIKKPKKIISEYDRYESNLPEKFPRSDFSPQFVSTPEGRRTIQWKYNPTKEEKEKKEYFSDLYFLNNINRLVGVKVKKDIIDGSLLLDDLIFWFNPTEAFFDSLPARIGNEIREEYRALLIRTDPSIPLAIKEKAPAVCTYFEECLPTFPNLKSFKVYPNPANDEVKIDIELVNPDKIRIILFDINGRPLNILKDCEEELVGQHRLNIPLIDFPNGIYILTIQNTNGDYKTQRIIKQ